ncbi:MAG: electron transfer flavoprotein subunit beta/FixA family protein [Bdellovibrionales bacterium]|nr:electron transfer flavoprotein subunit beta/FixA family protein [Bdellovibrionales bacterium]
MKILVPVKRVPDYEAKIKIKPDSSGVVTDGIKWIANPFDEIAVEEAIRLRDAGVATEVVVVGIGPDDAAAQLRYGMAMGADSGIHIKYDGEVDSDLASRVLEAVYRKGEYGFIIMGKQSIDSDANQTAQLLAARLGLPQACFASKVEIADGKATVTREVDGGLETLRISLPCVISTDLRLNEPRYASLPGIMKAKKKPMDETSLADLGVSPDTKIAVTKMVPPEGRKAGRKVADVAELVSALQNEAKVL